MNTKDRAVEPLNTKQFAWSGLNNAIGEALVINLEELLYLRSCGRCSLPRSPQSVPRADWRRGKSRLLLTLQT